MYCFNFFRNQLWQHLISYHSFRNMNMYLLEVSMSEKCRSSHFQSEVGSKKFEYWGWGGMWVEKTKGWGVSTSLHAMLLWSIYWPFSLQNFKKISYKGSRVMTICHFWTQCGPFAPNNFFGKTIIILIYLLAPFVVKN